MSVDEPAVVPDGSVVIPFRHREPDGPVAIVIGSSHAPYYLMENGATAPVAPQADQPGPA